MKVKELIKQLKLCNQEHEVYAFVNHDVIYTTVEVDETLTDRVDINLGGTL